MRESLHGDKMKRKQRELRSWAEGAASLHVLNQLDTTVDQFLQVCMSSGISVRLFFSVCAHGLKLTLADVFSIIRHLVLPASADLLVLKFESKQSHMARTTCLLRSSLHRSSDPFSF